MKTFLKDKATFKVKLTKQITNRSTEKVNHEEAFNTLHDKINENVSKLNEKFTSSTSPTS